MKGIFDIYSFKARLLPAYLVVLPVGLAVAALAPHEKWPAFTLAGLGVPAALGWLLAELARDAGKSKQSRLWESWGGPPTTQLLRHRNKTANPILREKWHARIGELTGRPLPSAASEARSPEKADVAYEAALAELRDKMRPHEQGALFFKENVSYGFRRNLWGMKPAGITLTVLAILVSATSIVWRLAQSGELDVDQILPPAFAGTSAAVLLVIWILRVRGAWVRSAAFAYAESFLGALLNMPTTKRISDA